MSSRTDYKRLWERDKKRKMELIKQVERLEGLIKEQAKIITDIKEGRIKINGTK